MKKMIILAALLPAISAFAGDLTVDNLAVEENASFYGEVNSYAPGGDVPMGPYTNQYGGGSSPNPLSMIPGASPIGAIHMFAAANAPAGWLLCNGAAVSRTSYSNLFAVIGTSYGAGDGSTTFNVPNLYQRFALGAVNNLGGTGGVERVTLTTSEMPAHTHPIGVDARTGGTNAWRYHYVASDGYRDSSYSWFANMQAKTAGGSQSHENMPPYLKVNFIIYSGP
ncbi:MAG: tail fiber protein [Kiritimatiellae bacterium]|nr:tail fiber protein [Kiritimatiellia bacterium]